MFKGDRGQPFNYQSMGMHDRNDDSLSILSQSKVQQNGRGQASGLSLKQQAFSPYKRTEARYGDCANQEMLQNRMELFSNPGANQKEDSLMNLELDPPQLQYKSSILQDGPSLAQPTFQHRESDRLSNIKFSEDTS